MFHFFFSIDKFLFLLFNKNLSNPIFDFIFPIITKPENWLIPAMLGLVVFIYFKKKKAILIVLLGIITLALTDAISYRLLKPLFGRLRPCNPESLVEGGNFLMGFKKSFSFPSNHSANMFGLATIFFCFYKNKAIYFFGFASIIAFSRIYVGVHYPFDVLGGAVLGFAIGIFVYRSYCITNFYIHKNKSTKK